METVPTKVGFVRAHAPGDVYARTHLNHSRVVWDAQHMKHFVLRYVSCNLEQRGPTAFDLWAMLKKRDNLRVTSNKTMCERTDSQDVNQKREDK